MRKYKDLRREEKIEMKAMLTQTFWGRDKAWNNLMSHRESQRSGKQSDAQSKELLKALDSGRHLRSKHNIAITNDDAQSRNQSRRSLHSKQS